MTKLKIEIAKTPITLARGLMGRDELAADSGMLFKFPNKLEARFWGKNTYIPLDVAFINDNNEITAVKHIVPMSTKAVSSDRECIMAVEANAGFFKKNDIKVGQKIEVLYDTNGREKEIVFK